jgi:ATP-dependent DNA helicase DinG
MIAPRTKDDDAPPPALDIRGAVDDFFRPGGFLEQACRDAAFPFEHRPQQRQMAGGVSDALERRRHLAVEAGTGVGKSFAYLVPLILAAVERKAQVVVSTYTISLQEQLMYKDIPFLKKHLGVPFKAVLVKGRGNYLCLRRLARARRMEADLFRGGEAAQLDAIQAWAKKTNDGSAQDLPDQPSHDVWQAVCVEHGNCLWQKCPEYKACFFMKARAEIADAHVLIVNHHLLFSDLALRAAGASLLPPYEMLVVDEAHQMEQVASDHMGIRLSHYMFEHWLRRLYTPDNNKGILSYLKDGPTAALASRLWDDIVGLFAELDQWAGFENGVTQRVIPAPLDLQSDLPAQMSRLIYKLKEVADGLQDEEIRSELQSVIRRGEDMRNSLHAFLQHACEDHVYWLERQGGRRKQTVMYAAPIEVAAGLRETLFDEVSCVVMTSATLSVGGQLNYFKSRVGAASCDELSVGSPFDYGRQMRVIIPRHMPEPTDTEAFVPACAQAIRHYTAQEGGSFVLFTSDRLMRTVADHVRDYFTERDIPLLVQGQGLARHRMVEAFKEKRGSVLFGLDSFWMGVDVPGDALRTVIITRLPFAVPDQPLIKARMDRIKEKGGEPFFEYSVPEAVLKFRQGVGRLIRTASDEGVIVVLDKRIVSKRYGRTFLQSIPECPVEIVDEI